MRQVALTTSKGGITRLRAKGAALNDSLYDLVNGYITAARTIKARPGTRRTFELPPGTVGLVNFNGVPRVFSNVQVSGIPAGIELVVLLSPDGSDLVITKIHFAEPFLGALYVVAEFEDGGVYHYWLEDAAPWEPDTEYRHGDLVQPTTGSPGLVFRARRGSDTYPVWSPNAARTVADRIEPTVYTDFFYQVVATTGENPRSGEFEPVWPVVSGGQVTETPDTAPGGVGGGLDPPPPPPPPTPPPDGGGGGSPRYDLRISDSVQER